MEWIPLIVVVSFWISVSVYLGLRDVARARRNPDLGPVGAERYPWQRGEPPISNDPGGESF